MSPLKSILPLIVLLVGALAAWGLIAQREAAQPTATVREPPRVQVISVTKQPRSLIVRSQGVVRPRTEIDLVAEVGGKIVHVHPAFVAGGFFQQDEILVTIDPRDYENTVTQARVRVSVAERELVQEEAESRQASEEWKVLGEGEPDALALRIPQLKEKRDQLAAARAELENALLQRQRCDLRAPFSGKVKDKHADLSQFVRMGDKLARIHAIDIAEVRLPVSLEQLGFLDVSLAAPTAPLPRHGPAVTLSARLAGQQQHWPGAIVRSEGAIDDKTSMVYLIAQVQDPYRQRGGGPPLPVGLFVQAEIQGREQSDLIALPPSAVNEGRFVLIVDQEQRVRLREVEVLQNNPDEFLVRGAIQANEQIIIAGLKTPVEGMKVKPELQAQRTSIMEETR